MLTIEEKVDTSKALDASLVDTESSETKSKVQDTSSRSRNDAHVDDADIRPIYDEELMAEVQTTVEINVFATGQKHTEQPEFNNKGEVDQNADESSTQVNSTYSTNIDNLSDVVICAFFASQPNSPQLVHEDLQQIHPDDMKEMDLRRQIAMECKAPRNQDNKNKESSRRSVPRETSTSTALVSCDGLGGYDWSDQADERPNYALMALNLKMINY
nr:hypothetical protein [Tanacetum cinerariifolium]